MRIRGNGNDGVLGEIFGVARELRGVADREHRARMRLELRATQDRGVVNERLVLLHHPATFRGAGGVAWARWLVAQRCGPRDQPRSAAERASARATRQKLPRRRAGTRNGNILLDASHNAP